LTFEIPALYTEAATATISSGLSSAVAFVAIASPDGRQKKQALPQRAFTVTRNCGWRGFVGVLMSQDDSFSSLFMSRIRS
jgi:hypothetical protein